MYKTNKSYGLDIPNQKIKITLDTNCINIKQNDQLNKLFKLQDNGKVQLYVPDGVIMDILKGFDTLCIADLPNTTPGEAAKKRLEKIDEYCNVIQGPLHCGEKVYGQVGCTCGGKYIADLEGKNRKNN